MRPWTCLPVVLLAACSAQPPYVAVVEKLSLLHQIEVEFNRSVDAEKSAVLATTDETSQAFATESKQAGAEVTSNIAKLRTVIDSDGRPKEKKDLETLEVRWEDLKALDARVLALAVANTNLKAIRLSNEKGVAALDRLVSALQGVAAGSTDPERMRELSGVSIDALQVQVRLPAHIASGDDTEMTKLEQEMRSEGAEVERLLAKLRAGAADAERKQLDVAVAAWSEYQGVNVEVVRLSRENTNVRSFELSTNETRRAAQGVREAIAVLVADVDSTIRATR